MPLFEIISEENKIIKWIGNCSEYGLDKSNFFHRPQLYKWIYS